MKLVKGLTTTYHSSLELPAAGDPVAGFEVSMNLNNNVVSQPMSQLASQLWIKLGRQFDIQLRGQLESQLRIQLESQLWGQLREDLYESK